jgi:hypothetical protein
MALCQTSTHAAKMDHFRWWWQASTPGLAALTDPDPPLPTPLRAAAGSYQHALNQLTQQAGLAA